jgi:hypothetical protein
MRKFVEKIQAIDPLKHGVHRRCIASKQATDHPTKHYLTPTAD